MTRSSHPLVDLLARLSGATPPEVGAALAVYVDDTARRADTVAALREVTRCPSCGCDVEACPLDGRDDCAIVNSLPTHGEVMAMPGHLEAERREHPSEPPPFGLRGALVADLRAAGEPHFARVVTDDFDDFDAAAWIRLRALPVWSLLSEQVRAAIVAAAEPTGEGGGFEGWESPADAAYRIMPPLGLILSPTELRARLADGIRARDAATSARLLALLAEPGTPAQMAARLHGFARVLGGAK